MFVRPLHSLVECPGLVIEWRKAAADAWEAQVTYVEPRARVVTEWVPADRLRPVQ